MDNPFEFPATLRSEVLGEIVFDAGCSGYVPSGNRDPDVLIPGAPDFIIWVPESGQFVATDFIATLDRTWGALFARIDDVLRAGIPLIVKEIVNFTGLEEHAALKIAKQVSMPKKVAMVKLNLVGPGESGNHELSLNTVGLDDEVGDHDLFLCLGQNLEPVSVYFDG
jgi:hypothetical protein